MAINGKIKSLADEIQQLQAARDARAFAWLAPYLRVLDVADLAVVAEVSDADPGRTDLVLGLFSVLEMATPENRLPVAEFESRLYPGRVSDREAKKRATEQASLDSRVRIHAGRVLDGSPYAAQSENWLTKNGYPVPEHTESASQPARVAVETAPPPPPPAAGEILARYVGDREFEVMTISGPTDVERGRTYSLPLRTWANIQELGPKFWQKIEVTI